MGKNERLLFTFHSSANVVCTHCMFNMIQDNINKLQGYAGFKFLSLHLMVSLIFIWNGSVGDQWGKNAKTRKDNKGMTINRIGRNRQDTEGILKKNHPLAEVGTSYGCSRCFGFESVCCMQQVP